MTPTQYHAALTTTTAGLLRQAGCQILAASAINGRPWLKAKLPSNLTPAKRRHLLAITWQTPTQIEWRTQ
jgi:hypothetical protein